MQALMIMLWRSAISILAYSLIDVQIIQENVKANKYGASVPKTPRSVAQQLRSYCSHNWLLFYILTAHKEAIYVHPISLS